MHLPVEKNKIIVNDALKLTPCLQPYKQNLLNFRHNFLFGVSSKISSFWHYFTLFYKALNILFKFVCRLRNVLKNKNFEFSHNLKWYIIRISFERVLRNIQKDLLLNSPLSVNDVTTEFFNKTSTTNFAPSLPSWFCDKSWMKIEMLLLLTVYFFS